MTDIRPVRPTHPAAPAGLAPEQDGRGALSRLVEVLLDKGVYLDLDLVVTVAEVPLIAVDIRAAVAGVETMIEYGFLGPWDRAGGSAQAAVAAAPPDEVATRSEAWYREPRLDAPAWRRGTLVIEERSGALRWQGDGDLRAALRLARAQVTGVRLLPGPGPRGGRVLELRSGTGTAELAGADAERWAALIRTGLDDPGRRSEGARP
jgi:hypothetical protein